MGRHHYPARHPLWSHRYLWAVVETAHHLIFWTLLELIGGQMQTRLDERMIQHRILFPAGHKGEASQVGEHGSRAILAVEPQKRAPVEAGTP